MGGATTEVTAATTDVLIESAHFDPITVARSVAPAQAARPRPPSASSAASTPTSPPAAAAARRRPAGRSSAAGVPDAGVTDVDLREPREPVRARRRPCRPGWSACDYTRAGRRRHAARDRLRRSTTPARARTCSRCCRRRWRPDLQRRCRPGRGGRPAARLRPDPVRAAPGARPGRGLTHDQRVRRVGRRHPGRARACVEVLTYPFVGGDGARPARPGGRRPATQRAAAGQPAVRGGAADCAPRVLATLLEALRRNVARGQRRRRRVRARAWSPGPSCRCGSAPRPRRRRRRPDDETLRRCSTRCPHQPRRGRAGPGR